MNEICPACRTAAIVRDTKAIVWINCETCGYWVCASTLFAKMTEPADDPALVLSKAANRNLIKLLRREGYSRGKHCMRVLLYNQDLPSIAPLADVVPVHVRELSDSQLFVD